ncbi:ZIP zinc transporter domain-containing protein [Ditylenchus destructor]|nr:ZIP zinc transporter domain-containing protein [Ditylenchus destructor]
MLNATTSDPPTPVPYIPTRNALKATLLIVLAFATFLASASTLVLKSRLLQQNGSPSFTRAFSFVSVFGAGVFLATCLLDLLPDSIESVEKAEESLGKFDFPISELCIAIGFLLVLFIEQIIMSAHERHWFGNSAIGHFHNEPTPEHQHTVNTVDHSSVNSLRHDETSPILPPGSTHAHGDSVAGEPHSHTDPSSHSNIRAILLVFALSLHAVFEGLSLGMIADVSQLLQIFAALMIHKTVIGFTLGVRLIQSRLKRITIVICFLIFAGQVVIGGTIGMILTNAMRKESTAVSDLVSGILQAVACGTFLYITCFEILPHELNQKGYRLVKMLCLFAGFALISIFVALFPDSP